MIRADEFFPKAFQPKDTSRNAKRRCERYSVEILAGGCKLIIVQNIGRQ